MKRCPKCRESKNSTEFNAQGVYCKLCHSANSKEWRKRHPEWKRKLPQGQQKNTYYKDPETGKTRKTVLESIARWKRTEKGRLCNRAKTIRYRARKLGAVGSHTQAEWNDLLERYGHICPACGRSVRLFRDHVVPLSKGGTDFISNIQPMCNQCNSAKGNRSAVRLAPWVSAVALVKFASVLG
jgi:5-methylcytosine-specific restriction endonuclease McrA